jgi:hypothetical protein
LEAPQYYPVVLYLLWGYRSAPTVSSACMHHMNNETNSSRWLLKHEVAEAFAEMSANNLIYVNQESNS